MRTYSGCGNTFTCIDNRSNPPLPTFTTDGLLLLEESDKADFKMRILNPDLSEAEMCGNGLRCFKLFLHDLGYTKPTYTIETLFTIHTVTSDGDIVTASMGTPKILSEDPLIIDTGVPHILTFWDDIKTAPVNTLGPALRQKHNANATFIQKNDPLLIRTYERGVEAETLACGTAACAAAYATQTNTVQTPSGEHLTITVKENTLYMTGPVSRSNTPSGTS